MNKEYTYNSWVEWKQRFEVGGGGGVAVRVLLVFFFFSECRRRGGTREGKGKERVDGRRRGSIYIRK